MDQQIVTPQQQLSKVVIRVWIIGEIIANFIGLLVLAALFFLDYKFSWPEWAGWMILVVTILSVVGTIWSVFFEPSLKFNSWRYDVNEDFLQLKYGIFIEKHELIPMTKIQSVATNQGPIMRKYGLYSVSITTMASSHKIPALSEKVAIELRSQIAYFAKVKEVE